MINKRVLMIFILHDLPPYETQIYIQIVIIVEHKFTNPKKCYIYQKYTKVDSHENWWNYSVIPLWKAIHMRIKCNKIAHVVTNRKICETFKSNDNFNIICCSPEPCVVLANSVYQIQCKNISTGVLLEKNPI